MYMNKGRSDDEWEQVDQNRHLQRLEKMMSESTLKGLPPNIFFLLSVATFPSFFIR